MIVATDPRTPPTELEYWELPDQPLPEVPEWLLEAPLSWDEPPTCGCECTCDGAPALEVPSAVDVDPEPMRWAVPGMWDDDPDPEVVTASVGPVMTKLLDVLEELAEVTPAALPEGQALGEAEALLGVQRAVRVLQLSRTSDVNARSLYEQRGFRSVAAWERSVAPDARASDRSLARKLTALPHLSAAVQTGRVSLAGATLTATALGKITRYLDQPDGLVQGVDGEELVEAIGQNTLDLLCQHHCGLEQSDPARAALLAQLQAEVAEILAAGGSQAARIEQLVTVLTARLPMPALKGALEDVVLQVLPLVLEEREESAQDKRTVSLTPNSDGMWDLSGTLTPECGELLFTALAAEARRDPANPVDTLLREQHRRDVDEADGRDPFLQDHDALPAWEQRALNSLNWEPGARGTQIALEDLLAAPAPCRAGESPLLPAKAMTAATADPRAEAAADAAAALATAGLGGLATDPTSPVGQLLVPRSRSKRLHDAFQRLLERYLSTGLGGVHGKVPVQASVTVSSRTLDNKPGAPPGRGGSGRPLARSLIRRWWCDAHVTTLLMSHGWTPLGVVHSARTITGTELKAARVQFDNRCAGDGCCPGTPDPLIPLIPHHVIGHAVAGRTSLGENLLVCETLHHDLHSGKKTVRLRDGRLLNEHGFVNEDTQPIPVGRSLSR